MNVAVPDPKHHATLKYFPPQTGVRSIKELIEQGQGIPESGNSLHPEVKQSGGVFNTLG